MKIALVSMLTFAVGYMVGKVAEKPRRRAVDALNEIYPRDWTIQKSEFVKKGVFRYTIFCGEKVYPHLLSVLRTERSVKSIMEFPDFRNKIVFEERC